MFEIGLFAAATRCMRAAVLCVAGRRTRCRGCAQADQLGVPAAQAIKYLRFAAIHRNVNIKDLDAEIRDFVDSRVPEDDTFSSEDVRELFESLKTTVRADAYKDLQRMAHSTVVLLRQCWEQAARAGIMLEINTGLLEDEKFLLEAKRIDEESERAAEPAKALAPAGAVGQSLLKLPGLDNAKNAEALQAENALMKQRLADLQQELVKVNRDKTRISDHLLAAEKALNEAGIAPPPAPHDPADEEPATVTALPSGHGQDSMPALTPLGSGGSASAMYPSLPSSVELMSLPASVKCGGAVSSAVSASGAGQGAAAELAAQLEAVSSELEAKRADAAAMEQMLTMKVQQTPQFKQQQQILMKKNQEIKTLREALKGYGWQDPDAQ